MKFATLAALVATVSAAPDCDSKGCKMCMVQTVIATGRVKDTRCGPPMAECQTIAARVNEKEPDSKLTCNPQEESTGCNVTMVFSEIANGKVQATKCAPSMAKCLQIAAQVKASEPKTLLTCTPKEEQELIETVRKTVSLKDEASAKKQHQNIYETLQKMSDAGANDENLQRKIRKMQRAFERKMNTRAPKYMKELQAWGQSPSVKADLAYASGPLVNTNEFKKLVKDSRLLERKFAPRFRFSYTTGLDQAGNYYQWMDNNDVKVIFEDIYQIKEDLKAFVESKEAAKAAELDALTMNEPQFANIVQMVMEDINFSTVEELQARLMKVGMAIKNKLQGCPFARKLAKQVVTLARFVKKAEKISDLPDMKKVEQWMNKKNFQPWE